MHFRKNLVFEIRLLRTQTKKIVPYFTFNLPVPTQFNTKGPLPSAPKIRQFSTKKPQFNTSVSSTPKNRQFITKTLSAQHTLQSTRRVLNWRFFCVELRGVLNGGVCWIERCFGVRGGLNWRVFGFQLTNFGCWKGVVRVLNWCVELRVSVLNWGILLFTS